MFNIFRQIYLNSFLYNKKISKILSKNLVYKPSTHLLSSIIKIQTKRFNINDFSLESVWTNKKLDKKQINNIVSLYDQAQGSSFEIIEKVNPEIIGGFILRVGDRQIDTSISKEIRELKKAFSDNPYIAEF